MHDYHKATCDCVDSGSTGPVSASDCDFFEFAPEPILIIDPETNRVRRANQAACDLYGYSYQEFIGKPLADFIPDPASDVEQFLRVADQGGHYRTTHLRNGNASLRLEFGATRMNRAGTAVLVLSCRGIADVERQEEQFRQAAKMEAVGQLAGGVAHDFNNLLTVINGYAEMLTAFLTPGEPAAEAVAEILSAGHRAADLTRQLLTFSRKHVVQPRVVNVYELVENLRKMLTRLLGGDIRLVVKPPTHGAVTVWADPGQLEQVVINLAVNARDAMPTGGVLTIEVREYRKDTANPIAELVITDTGSGMSEEVRARIFEPFFTTKELGKGTGLGLATVRGIIEQAGGTTTVTSRTGYGTSFRIRLPVVRNSIAPEQKKSAVSSLSGTGTILLVEDEEPIRVLALQILQANGYTVLDAENGEQALRTIETFHVPIQLLITDVVMPGMSGPQLSERLTLIQPDVRVLYISGSTGETLAHHGIEKEESSFIQKPFTPTTLLKKVQRMLNTESG